MALYFGKIGKTEQLEQAFYAGGEEGNSWYGGIRSGDFVFPIAGKVDRLWRVKEYVEQPNNVNTEDPGVVTFEIVKKFIPTSIQNFLRFKYFELDLNILNKTVKPIRGCGFHPIALHAGSPEPAQIDFASENLRSIYVVLNDFVPTGIRDLDILVVIKPDQHNKLRIDSTKIIANGVAQPYPVLWHLYEEKNPANERYSLDELFEHAQQDGRDKKEGFLGEVLDALRSQRFVRVEHPVHLYDYLLYGRRRLHTESHGNIPTDEDEPTSTFEIHPRYDKIASLLDQNPNLILYGPPGTGKTYAAKRVIEAYERKRENPSEVHFEDLAKQSRVEFLSFHQSYSYEEFVEGIRPEMAGSDESNETSTSRIKYSIEPGRLRKIADAAQLGAMTEETKKSEYSAIRDSAKFWKVSLGQKGVEESIYQKCKTGGYVAVGWLDNKDLKGQDYDQIFQLIRDDRGPGTALPINDASSVSAVVNDIANGDVVLIYDGPETIRDIGVVTSEYHYNKQDGNPYPHRRKVKWLRNFVPPANILDMNGGVRLTLKTIYRLDRIGFADIRRLVQPEDGAEAPSTLKPYYLVIDEINRGNMSKIFGELITLIEKDKREKESVTLLYSGKRFTLPRNLYIIGTMNTADRSIAMLDAALRRRFTFVEMEPDISVFSEANQLEVIEDRINVGNLLNSLNTKITEALDRDHRIGHSYLMDLSTLEDLHYRWYYQIVPLMMDYFYGDFEKVKDIVGAAFFDENENLRIYDLPAQKEQFMAALESILKR